VPNRRYVGEEKLRAVAREGHLEESNTRALSEVMFTGSAVVPEPSGLVLAASGIVTLLALVRRRRLVPSATNYSKRL
jgi:hypothetical protein